MSQQIIMTARMGTPDSIAPMSATSHHTPSLDDRSHESPGARPAEAPDLSRRIMLTRKQLIGLPLLLLVPLLSLFGVFGEHRTEIHVESGSLSVSVNYPDRFRYRQMQRLDIALRNTSTRPIDTLRVSLDTGYVSRFASVRIVPAPRSAFVVDLIGVVPGATRVVTAELWGEQYGVHRGRIVASAGADSAVLDVRTIVFP